MILIRRNYSDTEADNKYAETKQQAKVRKAAAALGVISASSLGASVAGGLTHEKGMEKLAKKSLNATLKDAIVANRQDPYFNKIRSLLGYENELEHHLKATKKFETNGTKKILKAVGKNAVKGAAVGGAIAAGLYALSRKGLIKRNEKKNEQAAERAAKSLERKLSKEGK